MGVFEVAECTRPLPVELFTNPTLAPVLVVLVRLLFEFDEDEPVLRLLERRVLVLVSVVPVETVTRVLRKAPRTSSSCGLFCAKTKTLEKSAIKMSKGNSLIFIKTSELIYAQRARRR